MTSIIKLLDYLHVSLDHLLKTGRGPGPGGRSMTPGLVGFLQGFETAPESAAADRPPNDHRRHHPQPGPEPVQGTMTRVLTSALHISAGEAAGRVRAAETLAGRTGRVQRLVLESRCSRPPPITRPAQDDRHQTDRTGAEGRAMGNVVHGRLAPPEIPQSRLVRPDDGFGSIGDLQFGEDVGYVVADGLRAQVEVARDLGVGLVLGDQRQNLFSRSVSSGKASAAALGRGAAK